MLVIAFAGTIAAYNYATRPPPYKPKYHTIAHRFLDLQARYMSVPDDSYRLLDDVITQAKASVHFDPNIRNPGERIQQLQAVFNTIDAILIDKNFIFPAGVWTITLGESLADHRLSDREMQAALAQPHNARRGDHMKAHADEDFHQMACVPAAFLYMGIAEELGFELKLVDLPKHMFVRAEIDKTHWINWDANRGRCITDHEYISGWGVEPWQIRDKIFMQSLSPVETEAVMYSAVGTYLGCNMEFRGPGPAIDCLRRALALNSRDICSLSQLAQDLLFRPDPDARTVDEAMDLAQAAVNLQPNEAYTHQSLAFAYAARGETTAAVNEMNRAVEIDPDDKDAPQVLREIQSGKTEWEVYRSARPVMFWIEYQQGWLILPGAIVVLWLCVVGWGIQKRIAGAGHKPSFAADRLAVTSS
jgi:regulator of sirC expression with transglutaminase-like and TPR domain